MQEIFTLPKWFRIFCYAGAIVMLGTGAEMVYLEFTEIKGQNIIFMGLAFFFLAWSMYAYTRLKLVLDPKTVRFTGGLRPHHFSWTDITTIDMARVGRYSEAQLSIRYSDRTLRLGRSFFRKKPFADILDRVERYAPEGVFTAGYRQVKAELPA
ncbi:PH domain-containing protein [Chitinophaga eiseniae]|uniref:PH domain-containing protein n=1 Tax=Chitinophaga eiseniae TaxID=634771 RepID=A0A1T4SWI0_9BACT|nr:PH domain-containing protein [Chitinophaga eiseniae]SKA32563.1 PH domain-containing protein [Chitinophaga eiseniae]